jgi:ABC-2 type transport system permease protein
VLANVVFGLLLIFTGANVARDELPGWMQAAGEWLPFTNAIEAARRLADGETIGDVAGLALTEAAIGTVYAVGGYLFLIALENRSRRHATLERA